MPIFSLGQFRKRCVVVGILEQRFAKLEAAVPPNGSADLSGTSKISVDDKSIELILMLKDHVKLETRLSTEKVLKIIFRLIFNCYFWNW
jgi:hypothetical protein